MKYLLLALCYWGNFLVGLGRQAALWAVSMLPLVAQAADVDFRSSAPLRAFSASSEITLQLSECANVVEASVVLPTQTKNIPIQDFSPLDGNSSACAYTLIDAPPPPIALTATLKLADGSTQSHSEFLQADNQAPTLALAETGIAGDGGAQQVSLRFTATDDTDISYVAVSVLGLQASVLRASGGVVERAKTQAFADSGGHRRIYPRSDSSDVFSFALPLLRNLSAAEIQHDGLLLIDAYAVDASGNRSNYSRLMFTGSDIQEKVLALSVSPSRLTLTHPLDAATIIPSVTFEFRGLTPLPGAGSAVSYESTHPSLVNVSAGGIVYPVAETGTEAVKIRVRYPGLPMQEVPVTVNYSKRLVALHYADGEPTENGLAGRFTEARPFRLPALNRPFALPPLWAEFDDGSYAPLTTYSQLSLQIPELARRVLVADGVSRLTAHAAVSTEAPVVLIARFNGTEARLPVAALDAAPEIILQAPQVGYVGDTVTIKAVPKDDVGIAHVDFSVNGQIVAAEVTAPYQLQLPLSEIMLNQRLQLAAIAQDGAGQRTSSAVTALQVVKANLQAVPAYDWEMPKHGDRFVEQTTFRIQLALDRGKPLEATPSGITYVEYFIDGNKVGESHFALRELRDVPGPGSQPEKHLFELWRFDARVPEISVGETSRSVYAKVHTSNNQANSAAQLIRIIGNEAPTPRIDSPDNLASVVEGQVVPVRVQVSDDALWFGTNVSLLADGQSVASRMVRDLERIGNSQLAVGTTTLSFDYRAPDNAVGRTILLQIQAEDSHGETALSEPVRIRIAGDQAPSVALSAPIDGSQYPAGQIIELRANATDDSAVERVEFYAAGQLLDIDRSAPYAASYQTPDAGGENQIPLHAVAFDNKGQRGQSGTINITLGRDENAPVYNFVSPTITGTENGVPVAKIIENERFTLKIAGYDDVEAVGVTWTGVRFAAGVYSLTGLSTDKITFSKEELERVPGVFNGFSLARLVRAPAF